MRTVELRTLHLLFVSQSSVRAEQQWCLSGSTVTAASFFLSFFLSFFRLESRTQASALVLLFDDENELQRPEAEPKMQLYLGHMALL